MVEFAWVHAYATDDLYAGRRTPWAIFRSEWALTAAVVLLKTFRTRRVSRRFPPRLLDWIRSVGPSNICVNAAGPDAEATAILEALLDLADRLPDTEAFRQRLRARSTDCGGRGSHSWRGRGPSAVDSTPPGAAPKYPDPGQQGNDLSRSRGDRIWSGAGLIPCGFPSPPTTCLNFSLWRYLSVWRIWGGYFGRRHSG